MKSFLIIILSIIFPINLYSQNSDTTQQKMSKIISFISQTQVSHLVTSSLSPTYIVESSTNPNGFTNCDYSLIIIDNSLFSESILYHSVPVLLLTTGEFSEFNHFVVEYGGGFIYKPFTPDELLTIVYKIINK